MDGMADSVVKVVKAISTMLDEGAEGYLTRRIGSDYIDGLVVSTVNTVDCGPETAIIDDKATYIVERYDNIEKAKLGHIKWCEEAKTLTEVEGLGYDFIPGPGVVELVRDKSSKQ